MTSRRFVPWITAALLLALWAWAGSWWPSRSAPATPGPAVHAAWVPAVADAAPHAPRSRAAAGKPRARAPATLGTLATRFEQATDLRAFVAEARRQPSLGGSFHALRALAECRQHAGVADGAEPVEPAFDAPPGAAAPDHARLQRRGERLDRSARRCAAFLPDELDDAAVAELRAEGEAGGDPLLVAYRAWLQAVEAVDYTRMEQALAAVFAQDEPLLLEWVGLTGADYWIAARPDAPIDESARRLARDAWRLLPCALGARCDRGDVQADADCAALGQCDADRWQSVFRSGGWENDADRRALTQEVAWLAQAVQERDARKVLGLTPRP
jgi:hypothetical protein